MKCLLCLVAILLTITPMICKGEVLMMSEEEQLSFLNKVQIRKWIGDDSIHSITCFDVNERGDIVIGINEANGRSLVSIYNNTGHWLWGYSFKSNGKYYLEWDSKETINIYWVRSSVKGTFDSQANCLALNEYKPDSSMNDRFLNLGSCERVVDNTRYYLTANLGCLSPLAFTYSRVVCITPEDQEIVIVDMKGSNIGGAIFLCVLIVSIVIAISISLKRYIFK